MIPGAAFRKLSPRSEQKSRCAALERESMAIIAELTALIAFGSGQGVTFHRASI
jgi:hypothetical protein